MDANKKYYYYYTYSYVDVVEGTLTICIVQ